MRVYAVLSGNSRDDNVILNQRQYPWVLASFQSSEDPRESLTYTPKLLLDSGAFTVWTLGKQVDINELIAWAREVCEHYAPSEVRLFNLDVIPGTITAAPTARERLRAAAESAENAGLIRAAGLPVIEVYHRYEPIEVLEAILERRQPNELISLGGLVGRSGGTRGKMEFCDQAFACIRDFAGGWQNVPPVHGLGVSGEAPLAKRYPWYSVDSSTWFTMRNYNVHVTRNGKIKGDRGTAPRTTPAMVAMFSNRRLELWERLAGQLSAMWDQRGVTYADIASDADSRLPA